MREGLDRLWQFPQTRVSHVRYDPHWYTVMQQEDMLAANNLRILDMANRNENMVTHIMLHHLTPSTHRSSQGRTPRIWLYAARHLTLQSIDSAGYRVLGQDTAEYNFLSHTDLLIFLYNGPQLPVCSECKADIDFYSYVTCRFAFLVL